MTAAHQPGDHHATQTQLAPIEQDAHLRLTKQEREHMHSRHDYHTAAVATDGTIALGSKPSSEITDAQWEQVAPLLTLGHGLGRPYADPRRTLNGILYVLRTQCGWRHMPKRYGSYVTCWRRLARWQAKGIWKQVERIVC